MRKLLFSALLCIMTASTAFASGYECKTYFTDEVFAATPTYADLNSHFCAGATDTLAPISPAMCLAATKDYVCGDSNGPDATNLRTTYAYWRDLKTTACSISPTLFGCEPKYLQALQERTLNTSDFYYWKYSQCISNLGMVLINHRHDHPELSTTVSDSQVYSSILSYEIPGCL